MDEKTQTIDEQPGTGLAESLSRLHEAWTRPDFQAAARQHARGKLTVREKIACLFDAGTFTEEDAPSADLNPRHGERRLLTGCGDMNGRPVAVAIFNSAIAAGSVTISTGEKLIQHMQLAEQRRCPLLIDWDSGGADINDGVASLDIFRKIFTQINELSGRIPMLSILSGLNAGGGAYAPVMTDTVIMIDGSMMAVTGPQVIRVATGEEVTPDEMGGAQLHSEQSGEAHYRVATYGEAAALARKWFSYLPQSMWSLPPRAAAWDKRGVPTDLRAIVTQARHNARLKRNATWDVRTFIEAAVDDDSWFECHEKFATSAVVGLARVAGISVVVIANQRQVLGGSMTADSSSKVTRILKLANAYHLPVITLVDVPGFHRHPGGIGGPDSLQGRRAADDLSQPHGAAHFGGHRQGVRRRLLRNGQLRYLRARRPVSPLWLHHRAGRRDGQGGGAVFHLWPGRRGRGGQGAAPGAVRERVPQHEPRLRGRTRRTA